MDARVELPASPHVDAAIMRVLAAEQAARAEVERCKLEAEQALEEGRRRARDIAERAARRAAHVHRWTEAAIAARIAALESQRTALLQAEQEHDDPAALLRAVEQVADELAGGSE